MFHRAVRANKRLLLAFHKSFRVLSLERRSADLPVPVSFFVTPLLAAVFARCFTVNHCGKPGPLLPRVVRKISWLVLMFCWVSGGQAGLIPMLFVSGVLPDPQLCLPPPLLQRYFSGPVHGAVPTQIEICQCALCLL